MLRNLVAACAVIQMLSATTLVIAAAADFGTAEEAKAMLERAVAEVKEDKAKALDLFNTGEGGFKADPGRYDLYVSLACPWAHRTLIFRALKHLENAISLSVVLGLWAKRAGRSMRTPALFRIRSLGRAVCMRSISALTRPTLGGFVLDLWPPSTRSNSGGPPN